MKKNYTTERDKGHDIETLARSVTDRKQFNSELFQDLDKSLWKLKTHATCGETQPHYRAQQIGHLIDQKWSVHDSTK